MNKQFTVKYQTKQGGNGTAVTTQVSANSSAEAKSKVKQSHPGCTIVSCTEKQVEIKNAAAKTYL